MTCKTVTVKGKKKQQCTTRIVSGTVTFNTAAADRATLTRGRTVYATGASVSLSHGRTRLLLTYRRRVRPGRYTLTLRHRHGRGWRIHRQVVTIR